MGLITIFLCALVLSLLAEWCASALWSAPRARLSGRPRGRRWLLSSLAGILFAVVYVSSWLVLGVVDVSDFPAVEFDPAGSFLYLSGMLLAQLGWRPLIERIHRTEIEDYYERLVTAAEASGTYAGLTSQPHRRSRRVTVYGVGDAPPTSLAAVIADAPNMLEVAWQPAPYTHAELVAERDRVLGRFPQLHRGHPTNEGTRLEFTTTDPELLAAPDAQAALDSRYPALIEYGEPVS